MKSGNIDEMDGIKYGVEKDCGRCGVRETDVDADAVKAERCLGANLRGWWEDGREGIVEKMTAGFGGGNYSQSVNNSERNQEATVFVGGLDEKVTDEVVWELMVQAGAVKHVYIPRDRITGQAQGYGFCEFRTEEDAQYAVKIMNMVKLFGKAIKVQPSSEHKRNLDVGANIFIGNLDPDVDENLLYETFSAFGAIIETPHVMRDPDTGNSKGFGFVKYNSFEASDAAIEAMNGGFIMNRAIVVQYAYKKDGNGRVMQLSKKSAHTAMIS